MDADQPVDGQTGERKKEKDEWTETVRLTDPQFSILSSV